MSDPTATTPTGDAGKSAEDKPADKSGSAFTPITSQDDFDHKIGERLARERERFADYDDLKAKAEKLKQLEDASKTESQRTNEQLAALQKRVEESEKRAAAADQAALRASIASAKGVPENLLPKEGTREQLEAKAEELKAWAKQNGAGGLGAGAGPTGGSGESGGKNGGVAAGRELFEASHKKASTN